MAQAKSDKTFTVPELANYLRMKPITIYKHAAAGKIPGFKVGSYWRFRKDTIDAWIEAQERTSKQCRTVTVKQNIIRGFAG